MNSHRPRTPQQRRIEAHRRSMAGFTLIEIAIAVMILATSLVTVLGLQSAIIRSAIATQNKQGALLLSRRILAAIETSEEPIEIGDETKLADDFIQQYLGSGNTVAADDDQGKNYSARLTVEYWPIPNVDERALKRVKLDVWRTELPDDHFDVLFFIPNEDDRGSGDDEEG